MTRSLKVRPHSWPMKEPFTIARGTQTVAEVVVVELTENGATGRSEAACIYYKGETIARVLQEIEQARPAVEAGATREELLKLLPAGGARNALDSALWDLEARLTGMRAWQRAGMKQGAAITTAITIGIRDLAAYEASARSLADHPWIKVKVDRTDPIAAIKAVRRGAPSPRLVVDANQAWSVDELKRYADALVPLGVDLLEQPVAVSLSESLEGIGCPIPICADEAVDTVDDLPRLAGCYDFINIKLDKTGGLTAALTLARAARESGFRLMSGCMVGGSLAMAPAMVLGQICEINDLDGPVLQAADWPGGIQYQRGIMTPPWPSFWG